ncbi:hypothetical protein SAMN04487897_101344 [Paenibacillus sp. yr247]|uniref:hypothetical protein n=1 Tax=Paenibacillus sp. yr247 TaxID=1761880 RepID=UPI000884ACA1|nr:hypothetical protein [Paenibacillus sp. yr247]SDM87695.1 hypothetical protein SAMN04487897_101344 [Paenibacillus sp. yr247]
MKKKQSIVWMSMLAILVIAAGCGQKNTEKAGQSFGSAVISVDSSVLPSPSAAVSPSEQHLSPSASLDAQSPPSSPTPSALAETVKPEVVPDKQMTAGETPKASVQPKIVTSPSSTETNEAKTGKSAASTTIEPKQPTLSNEINWTQFFDDDKQDKPSSKFWDMSGKTVQIKGFMGEVLSFDKHWFLLIPKPGAECPFDNGDETYWNKIMIVFVPDNVKLRYTSGPLLLTGKLDVGVKLDESGYKTMFRLYDASFEKIKE